MKLTVMYLPMLKTCKSPERFQNRQRLRHSKRLHMSVMHGMLHMLVLKTL